MESQDEVEDNELRDATREYLSGPPSGSLIGRPARSWSRSSVRAFRGQGDLAVSRKRAGRPAETARSLVRGRNTLSADRRTERSVG
jgi:hypothetical protein